jgi:hypothetical protein
LGRSEPQVSRPLSKLERKGLIQKILSEIEVGLECDLELIQEFITREAFGELKA